MDPADLDLEDERFSPEATDTAIAVSWGLSRLRRSQAELLESMYFEGKNVREIATDLGTAERAVEGRLRRARNKLKRQLEPLVSAASGGTNHAEQTRTR